MHWHNLDYNLTWNWIFNHDQKEILRHISGAKCALNFSVYH